MVMTDAAKVHSRMSVILTPNSYAHWTNGTSSEAERLAVPYEGPLVIDRTDEWWARRLSRVTQGVTLRVTHKYCICLFLNRK